MNHLHIVSFNVPYPADYGGVIDVYHRIRSLSKRGVAIHLHCYTYGRAKAPQLESLCEEVHYYEREMFPRHLLSKRPFIVDSRCSRALLNRLRQDDYPIWLEGLHCCDVLQRLREQGCGNRPIYVRAHNVEHDYYSNLADVESRWLKRLYLRMDARKLLRYEPILLRADGVFAVTDADAAHFRSLGCGNVCLLPTAHPFDTIETLEGQGNYACYHADLSVPENINAVRFLICEVFSRCRHSLVVAGRNPALELQRLAARYDNVRIVASPSDSEMQRLVQEAQVNILVTDQATGLKLKLLNSLYCGRHCLVNSKMVQGTPLHEVCVVADGATQLLEQLNRLMEQPFTESLIEQRRNKLRGRYDNDTHADAIVSTLFT